MDPIAARDPRITGVVVGYPSRFTPEQQSRVAHGAQDFSETLLSRGGNWYIVRLRLTNDGADSSTQNWRARVKWNGEWLDVKPEAQPWAPPSDWNAFPFWDLSRAQSDALTRGPAYHVFFWVNIKGPSAYVEVNSFQVTFDDNKGVETLCTVVPG